MRLEREDKLEATSDGLWMDVAMVVLEVGEFGIFPLIHRKDGARFVLVSLNIDAIPGEVSHHWRRKKFELRTSDNRLSDSYYV